MKEVIGVSFYSGVLRVSNGWPPPRRAQTRSCHLHLGLTRATALLRGYDIDPAQQGYDVNMTPQRYDTDMAQRGHDTNSAWRGHDTAATLQHQHGAATPQHRHGAARPRHRHHASALRHRLGTVTPTPTLANARVTRAKFRAFAKARAGAGTDFWDQHAECKKDRGSEQRNEETIESDKRSGDEAVRISVVSLISSKRDGRCNGDGVSRDKDSTRREDAWSGYDGLGSLLQGEYGQQQPMAVEIERRSWIWLGVQHVQAPVMATRSGSLAGSFGAGGRKQPEGGDR
ncbi:hypothetical protein EDB86DRAFT_2834266 [Lactarius hatsudake]|nr:hypothetical protein EDB86DRAFT_2834266 [Lactarius hatsudake]